MRACSPRSSPANSSTICPCVGVDLGVIDKQGTWLSYQTNRLGQGREAAREELKNNPKLASEIEQTIHAKMQERKASGLPQKTDAAEPALRLWL